MYLLCAEKTMIHKSKYQLFYFIRTYLVFLIIFLIYDLIIEKELIILENLVKSIFFTLLFS